MRRSKVYPFIAMMALALAVAILAPPDSGGAWTHLLPIYGGHVGQIEIDARGDLYCLGYGVHKSTDGANTWTSAQGDLPTTSVGPLAAHPTIPGLIFLGANTQGIYRTTNGGVNWTLYGTGLPAYGIRRIVISRSNPDIMYVASVGDGVYKSTDGGLNWVRKCNGLQKTSWCGSILPINGMDVDPGNDQRVYANVHRSYYHKSTDGANTWVNKMSAWGGWLFVARSSPNVLFMWNDGRYSSTLPGYYMIKSTDFGETWSGVTSTSANWLTIDPNDADVVYMSTSNGLYKSTDGGSSWTKVLTVPGNQAVNMCTVDPSNSNIVYAGTAQGVFKSTDAGQNWTQKNNGIANAYLPHIDVNESDPTQLFVSAYQVGVFKSADSGQNWDYKGYANNRIWDIVTEPNNKNAVFLAYGGTQKSTDGGDNWRSISSGAGTIGIHPLVAGKMFASTSDWKGGILMSTDYGETWFNPQFQYVYPTGEYAFHPTDANRIWVGYHRYTGAPVDTAGIAYSTNGGYSWSRVEFGYGYAESLIIDPNNPSVLYCVDANGVYNNVDYRGVWKSTNSGISWVKKTAGLPIDQLRDCIIIDPNTGDLYVATRRGIYRSLDGGDNWSSFTTPLELPHQNVHWLAMTPNGNCLYATTNGGVYGNCTSINDAPVADAGGAYAEPCSGQPSQVQLDGTRSFDPNNDPLTYRWSNVDCPGASFSDATSSTPTLTISGPPPCPVECTVTLTVTDSFGESDSADAMVTIFDTEVPVLSGVPANETVECDAVPPAASPMARDTCDPDVAITFRESRADGRCDDIYTLTRTWTATDDCTNSITETQIITVQDNTAPTLSGVPINVTVECDSVPAAATPSATDNCDPSPSITFTEVRANGNCQDNYTLTRTWEATDRCGNVFSDFQTIKVQDTTAPILSGVPSNVTVECDSVPTPARPTATDNCDANVNIVLNEVRTDGPCVDTYTLTRTWTATDNCSNSTLGTQVISVQDTTAPILMGVPVN
ncbi:hypothetical protein ACFLU6_14310, partial [Acidobacteriota bacterium]